MSERCLPDDVQRHLVGAKYLLNHEIISIELSGRDP